MIFLPDNLPRYSDLIKNIFFLASWGSVFEPIIPSFVILFKCTDTVDLAFPNIGPDLIKT